MQKNSVDLIGFAFQLPVFWWLFFLLLHMHSVVFLGAVGSFVFLRCFGPGLRLCRGIAIASFMIVSTLVRSAPWGGGWDFGLALTARANVWTSFFLPVVLPVAQQQDDKEGRGRLQKILSGPSTCIPFAFLRPAPRTFLTKVSRRKL